MGNEIEEFLKRAAQRRMQQAQSAPRPAPPPPRQAPISRPPLQQAAGRPVIDAEIVEVEPVSGDDVAEMVAQHLDVQKFTQQRTVHVAEDARMAQTRIALETQHDFEHGPAESSLTMSGTATSHAATIAVPAISALATHMRNPDNLRTMVILSEILGRPEHRW